ncbi:homoserine kinase [Occallatibacter savannae]|uniref:homoserine kinase n=1 Tax=Occallatibacter savannae TaxID=1002691 RepID=UPI000D68C61B|nr:homoserine kinase [Occallatibacter savannae]
MTEKIFRMKFPATSANLGSGFDTAAVALDFYLKIEAQRADEFSISANGCNAEICSKVENNLILETYRRLLVAQGRPVVPLTIQMQNEIPLGMGCGSSAAGRLAGIALAVHFGHLHWSSDRVLEEACALEGHPDNAAACWLGGFVAAAMNGSSVYAARVEPPSEWRAIVAYPAESLATATARAVLPGNYSSEDVVINLQSVSILGLAFAQARGDLLRVAMRDRIHQPYRSELCGLLPQLLPLAGREGILGIALSGAGPAVLAIVGAESETAGACELMHSAISPARAHFCVSRFQPVGAAELRG